MFEPETVNLSELPSFPLSWKKALPKTPGIYFAIDAGEVVQYIGRSIDINSRWVQHHRFEELTQIEGIRLAWLEVDELQLLPHIEKALIQYFKPKLNQTNVKVQLEKSESSRAGQKEYGEVKKKYQFMLTPTASQKLDEVADELNISRSEVFEQILRGMLDLKHFQAQKV